MLGAAKQDSMLTFEANLLSPVTTTRSISGVLSSSLSSKRCSTPLFQKQKDSSPNSENEIDSKADPMEEDRSNILDDPENSDKLVSAEDAAEATKQVLNKASNSELKAKLAKGIDQVLLNDNLIIFCSRNYFSQAKYKNKTVERSHRKSAAQTEAEQKNSSMSELVTRFLPKPLTEEERVAKPNGSAREILRKRSVSVSTKSR